MPLKNEDGTLMVISKWDRWSGGRTAAPLISLTRSQLADFFNVHPRTIDRWIKTKRLVITGNPVTDLAHLIAFHQERSKDMTVQS